MKKIFLFGFVVVTFWACSIDDSTNEDFYFKILPVENVSVPEEMYFGEVYTIVYSYYKPSTCYDFNDMYYLSENSFSAIAVINTVVNSDNCYELTDGLVERVI